MNYDLPKLFDFGQFFEDTYKTGKRVLFGTILAISGIVGMTMWYLNKDDVTKNKISLPTHKAARVNIPTVK